jgi:hypothetical protein
MLEHFPQSIEMLNPGRVISEYGSSFNLLP